MVDTSEDATRVAVQVRVRPAVITTIDGMAAKEERSRSAMIRILLTEALTARTR